MKRDMDLIRLILLQTEEVSGEPCILSSDKIQAEGYDSDAIIYHIRLLKQANFIIASGADLLIKSNTFNIRELTWQGCEFLALARNDTIWNKTKSTLAEKGLAFSVSFASEFMAGLALQLLQGG